MFIKPDGNIIIQGYGTECARLSATKVIEKSWRSMVRCCTVCTIPNFRICTVFAAKT